MCLFYAVITCRASSMNCPVLTPTIVIARKDTGSTYNLNRSGSGGWLLGPGCSQKERSRQGLKLQRSRHDVPGSYQPSQPTMSKRPLTSLVDQKICSPKHVNTDLSFIKSVFQICFRSNTHTTRRLNRFDHDATRLHASQSLDDLRQTVYMISAV